MYFFIENENVLTTKITQSMCSLSFLVRDSLLNKTAGRVRLRYLMYGVGRRAEIRGTSYVCEDLATNIVATQKSVSIVDH